MKTADLPLSENVEDRRGDGPVPSVKPRKTLAEMLAESDKDVPFKVADGSSLAKDAGVDDLK